MATRIFSVVLAVVVAVAVVSQASPMDDHYLYEHCRKVNEIMEPTPSSWDTPIHAYETAKKHVKSFGGLFVSRRRRELAAAWRAVTFDEACSPKSLAYVHSIWACNPSVNPSMKHLYNDVRKYAQKCLANEDLTKPFKQFAGDDLEKFLTSDLLAAYRRANPDEPPLHFGAKGGANCCQPEQAAWVLVEAVRRDFPQEAAKIKASQTDKEVSSELVDKFLGKHLYRPCESYTRRVDKAMDNIRAVVDYVLDRDMSRLPQIIREAIFRFKICQNLEYESERERFNALLAGAFY